MKCRIVCLVPTMLVMLTPSHSPGQSWFEYSNRADRFSVNLPGEPDVHDFDYESEFAAIFPARLYTLQDGSSHYSITVVDFTNAQRIHNEMDKTEAASAENIWINDQRASIIRAAREFRQRGSEVTYDGWGHIDRVEGEQLQLTNLDGTRTFAGIYLHMPGRRLYILEATVPADAPPPGQFQQSLRFLDEDENRVRYERHPDGSATRILVVVRTPRSRPATRDDIFLQNPAQFTDLGDRI